VIDDQSQSKQEKVNSMINAVLSARSSALLRRHLRCTRLPTIDEMHAAVLFIREEGCATVRKSS